MSKMPSLRQRVTTYFRQLSFIAEPRDDARVASGFSSHHPSDNGCFITRYLEGRLDKPFGCGGDIKHGKEPSDLPDLQIGDYATGAASITAACTGPDEGLTGVKRARVHLSAGPDIDFIDINQEQDISIRLSPSVGIKSGASKYNHAKQDYKADQNANKSSAKGGATKCKTLDADVKRFEANDKKTGDCVVEQLTTESTADQASCVSSQTLRNSDCLNKNEETLDNCDVINSIDNSNTELLVETGDPIAGVSNWKMENDHAFGMSVSLYEKNFITHEPAGSPIADCFGLVARRNAAVLAIADGVNWGEGAQLAARSAIHGCLEYIDTAVFGQGPGGTATSTREVFISLLRSVWKAHACILEVGGALSTLTVAVVLPLRDSDDRSVVCACNVGDSFGYVYSKKYGVREFTQGSHDITSMRDMRDALGAIGPYDGDKPELGNLTLSMTTVHPGDIVFLTSDGISDNFDPVVGKFAEPFTSDMPTSQKSAKEPHLAPKRQNKSASSLYTRSTALSSKETKEARLSLPPTHKSTKSSSSGGTGESVAGRSVRPKKVEITNVDKVRGEIPSRPKYMRSHTVIEPPARLSRPPVATKYPKSPSGLPLVTGAQRHILTLLRLEDLLCYGINGTLRPCSASQKLCQLLVDFARMITAAKRKILEQRELFYRMVASGDGGKKEVELNRLQQRSARKRVVEGSTFTSLPGKLDHASVVAFTVTSSIAPTDRRELAETDF